MINSDALIVLLPGVDAIDTADLGRPQEVAALVFLVLALVMFGSATLSAALGGKPAMHLLSRFGTWLRAHERTVRAVTGIVLGMLFVLKGATGLRSAG